MKKFAKIMLIALGVGLVAGVIGVLTSRPTSAQLPPAPIPIVPVKVTNTPLPVQGSVNANVTNTVPVSGTVNANVTNTVPVSGTVAVNSLPAISLNNSMTSPLFVRDVDNPANEPFQAALCYGVINGAPTSTCFVLGSTQLSSFAVPTTTSDGKTVKALVIQFVDGACQVFPGGVVPDVVLSTPASQNVIPGQTFQGDHLVPFTLNPIFTNPNSGAILQWATLMHTIVVASSEVAFFVDTQIGTQCGCTMNLSGYLVTQ